MIQWLNNLKIKRNIHKSIKPWWRWTYIDATLLYFFDNHIGISRFLFNNLHFFSIHIAIVIARSVRSRYFLQFCVTNFCIAHGVLFFSSVYSVIVIMLKFANFVALLLWKPICGRCGYVIFSFEYKWIKDNNAKFSELTQSTLVCSMAQT